MGHYSQNVSITEVGTCDYNFAMRRKLHLPSNVAAGSV